MRRYWDKLHQVWSLLHCSQDVKKNVLKYCSNHNAFVHFCLESQVLQVKRKSTKLFHMSTWAKTKGKCSSRHSLACLYNRITGNIHNTLQSMTGKWHFLWITTICTNATMLEHHTKIYRSAYLAEHMLYSVL